MEGQSPSQRYQESAEGAWEDPKEGPGKGQFPQPHEVQEAYVKEAEEISMSAVIQEVIRFRRVEWLDTSIIMSSMYINQTINFWNFFIDLLI